MNFKSLHWTAPKNSILPDFIISGAMKCGTSTLHAILNQHPEVYIPEKELHFFDMDNISQHPDFNRFEQGQWFSHNINESPALYWQWYSDQFESAVSTQLDKQVTGKMNAQVLGEDSTTYLASESAIKRIAQQNKKIKIVIMLRQPTARVYSHYWHRLRAGKAMFNFEDTLKFSPSNLLNRSDYLPQLKTLYSYLPKEQVKVIVFEDFLANKTKVIEDLCNFLDVDFAKLPSAALQLHVNHSSIPKYVNLHLFKSKMFRNNANHQYIDHFFDSNINLNNANRNFSALFERLYSVINPLIRKKPTKINPNTKKLLDTYFYRELQGLDELLKQDVLSKWFNEDV